MADQKAPAAVQAEEPNTDPRQIFKRVVVNRLNVDEKNQNLEIVVNDMGDVNGRAAFFPGQEVTLSMVQISILKDAVERNRIDIPAESGIYSSSNPREEAMRQFPGFRIMKNSASGELYAESHRPNYSIVEVGSIL